MQCCVVLVAVSLFTSADGMTDQPMSDLQITRVLSCQSTNQTSLFVEDDIIAALLALRLQLLKLMTFTFNPLFNVKSTLQYFELVS